MTIAGLVFFLCCLPILAWGKTTTYEYTDPARFGPAWEAESLMELNRRPSECFCGESPHSALWNSFQAQLLDNLAADPGFSGVWVHALCSVAHPWFFRLASFDPSGMLVINGDCSAGLVAMAVVCAQSIALQDRAPSPWKWMPGIVLDEGNSVGDFEGRVALAECVELCEGTSGCQSFAHGPNGCHLKDRCVDEADGLQPPEAHGDGYHTFFVSPCQADVLHMPAFSDVADVASPAAANGTRRGRRPKLEHKQHPRLAKMNCSFSRTLPCASWSLRPTALRTRLGLSPCRSSWRTMSLC